MKRDEINLRGGFMVYDLGLRAEAVPVTAASPEFKINLQ